MEDQVFLGKTASFICSCRYSINWQVFLEKEPCSKACHPCQLLNKENCSGTVQTGQRMVNTSEHRREGRLVQPSHEPQVKLAELGKTCGGKLVHCTHEQVKLPKNLSRKTWSRVRGLDVSSEGFSLTKGLPPSSKLTALDLAVRRISAVHQPCIFRCR